MMKQNTTYKTSRYGECTFSLILDKRHPKKRRDTFPVAMRYTIDRKSWYHFVSGELTEEDFTQICNMGNKANRSELYAKKVEFDELFDKYRIVVERLGENLTLDRIKSVITGVVINAEESFFSIWESIIHKLQTENGGSRCTTAESYIYALKSFRRIMWKHKISGFNIKKEHLEEWNNGMKNGVKDAEGKLVGKISDTTRGIYLRVCRAVWNECKKNGFLVDKEYPFSNIRQKDLVSIPSGETRRERYLTVEQMTTLYNVFINKSYPEKWNENYKERAHQSLGLFLVQYLCNGFNLVDASELTYSQYYFDIERRAFKFKRIKTTNTNSEGGSEVIIPIIEPLQRILDDIAAPPKRNKLVFPYILDGATTKAEKRVRTSAWNSNIQDPVIRICKEALGWEVRPSGTWCRHSFATNLAMAGVSRNYISESMGHSTNRTITDRYIASYPLEKQMEYNNKLLALGEKQSISEADIQAMSKKEMAAMLMKLMAK